jgi:hypothetical protein
MNAPRSGPLGLAVLLAAGTLILAPRQPLVAQPPPLSYRRVFVPEASLQSQIRGLLPLKRTEFEQRMQLASEQPEVAVRLATARIQSAIYQARLFENQLQLGTAKLSVVAPTTAPTLLALDPCNLALKSAQWNTDTPAPATVGADETGKLHCLVESSGILELDWSLSPAETSPAKTVFVVRLPPATIRRLEIWTPSVVRLESDSGIVSPSPVSPEQPGERMWTIDLSGTPEVRLSVHSLGTESHDRPLVVVRESANYSLLSASLDLESTFTLDVLAEPVHELKLRIDSGLRVTAVRLGDREVPCRLEAATEGATHSLVTCDLLQPLRGNHHVVQVTATADWAIGKGQALPRIQVEGGLLQAGQWSVSAPDWLQLTARPLRGCVQTLATSTSAGRTADRFEFQVFSADAAVEVSALEPALPLSERSGTQITVELNQVLGVLIAELSSIGRGRFEVEAEVPRHWIVDSVETEPSEVLVDRSLSAGGSGPQRLQIKLAQPMTHERPVRLIVRGHYRRPANGELFGHSVFQLASFPAARDSRRLVALRVNDPGAELRLADDENLVRLDPNRLTPADRALFETLPETLLFEADAAGNLGEAALQPTTASYRADVLVRAVVSRTGSEQTVSVRCQPEATAVGMVVVRLSPRPRGAVSWRLALDETRELEATVEESSALTPVVDEAVYRLLLPRSVNSPFEISGRWSVPGSGPVSLAWLPEANQQTAVVEVHSTVGPLEIETHEVRPLPRPGMLGAGSTTLQARYSYETGQQAYLTLKQPLGDSSEPAVWIEMLQVTSHLAPGGNAENVVELTVQNAGASHLRLRLPVTVNECLLVSAAGDVVLRPSANNDVEIPLPAEQRRSVLQLHYTSAGPSLGVWPISRIRTPIPQVDVPVLARVWRIGLPPDSAPLQPSRGSPTGPAATAAEAADRRQPMGARSATAAWISNLSWLLAGPQLAASANLFARPTGEPSSEAAFRGWEIFSRDFREGEEPVITIYRPTVLATWATGLCLAVMVITLRLRPRVFLLVLMVGLCAAVAIATQPPASWIAAGVAGGLALGGALRTFVARQSAALQSPRRNSWMPASATLVWLALSCVVLARCVFAAPPTAISPRARVVFPTDAHEQPSGEYVYLDPDFYEALHRLPASLGRAFPDWLLESARYEFPTEPQQRAGGAVLDELKAAFEFHTFRAGTVMHLALRRDQVSLVERRARLDGVPAALDWTHDGNRLSVTVAAPGKHRLELTLAATAQAARNSVSLEIATPPAAFVTVVLPPSKTSREEVRGPAPGNTVDDGSQIFPRNSASRLAVRWPARETNLHSGATVEAEQLLWWKIRSASVVLEAQFVVRSLGAPLEQIVVDADPRLRPLPGLTAGPVARVQNEAGFTNRTTVELAEPASEVRFRLGWLWPDASGAGTLVLPQLNVHAENKSRAWTALSLEPGLEIAALRHPASGIDSAEFVRVWGDSTASPLAAYDAPPAGKSFAVTIHPTTQLPTGEQVIDWSLSESLAQVVCSIRLNSVPSTCFEHRLSLPPELKVQRVALSQSARPAAFRWMQQADGRLVITLLEPLAPTQTIVLEAELAGPEKGSPFPLPLIALENAALSGAELRIHRQSDVELSIRSIAGWVPDAQANLGGQRLQFGRLVAALRQGNSDAPSPPIVVRLPNRPQLAGHMLIQTDQADGDWRSEVALDLNITGGVLDNVRLIVPDEWAGPLEIEPKMEYRLEPAAGEARRLLVILPPLATAERLQVRLRGPLQVGSGGIQAPDIQLLTADKVERFVLLDRGSVGQPIDWATTGLVAADAPTQTQFAPAWQNSKSSLFRVIAPQFRALARYRPSVGKAAQVYLADIHTVLLPGRRVATTADYLVNPADANDLAFELPPGCRLVQVLLDGSVATCRQSGLRSWKVDVPSDVLPYELTIIYDSFLPVAADSSGRLILTAPHLAGLNAPPALWSLVRSDDLLRPTPLTTRHSAVSLAATALSSEQVSLLRVEAYVRALEAVQDARGSSVPWPVLAESFDRWQRTLEAADGWLANAPRLDEDSDNATRRRQAALNAAQAVRQRLVQAGVLNEEHSVAHAAQAAALDQPKAASFLVPGESFAWEMDSEQPGAAFAPSRLVWAICLAIATLAVVPLSRLTDVRNWLLDHSYFLLGCAGLAWWLIAPLGWLGWLPFLAAVGLGLRSCWPRARSHSGATIQRFSPVDSR